MTVKYSNKLPTGPYLNIDLGCERDLQPGETLEEGWDEIHQRALAWHKKNFPELYPEQKEYKPTHFPGVPDSKEERIQIMINDLNQSTSLKDLESWALLTRTSPLIKEAYDKKYNELQNKQP